MGPDLSILDVLSVRERDVFLLAAKGLSNGEMAQSLFVSEATVKTHLRSVLDKSDAYGATRLTRNTSPSSDRRGKGAGLGTLVTYALLSAFARKEV
jgi:hypothetical protein